MTAELTQLKKAVAEQLYYDFQAVLTGTPERNAVTRAVAEANIEACGRARPVPRGAG